MKVNAKGMISTTLVALTLASAMTACSSNSNNSNSSPSSTPSASPSDTTSTASAPAASPTTEHRTLTVEVFDRGKPGQPDLNNNFWTKYVNDNFGKQFNATVKYVSVPRAEEVDKLNVLMAAGQAPDLSFTYNQNVVYNYVQQGGLAELDDAIAQYGPNLTKYLGEDVLKYGKFNGKQYAVPGKRTVLAGNNTFIRKDWLDKLGLPVPTTPQEFYDTMVAFKEKNPGNVDGVIPYGYSLQPAYPGLGYIPEAFKPSNLTEEQFATLEATSIWNANWNLPGFEDAVKYMNKMYNNGLISPNFAIDKDGKMLDADISNGKVGAFQTNWDGPYRTAPGDYANLQKNVPGAELIPIDPWSNDAGQTPKNGYSPNGIDVIVPAKSKNVDLVIQYLNWLADPEVAKFLQNGEEGVDYNMVDGVPIQTGTTTSGDKMMTVANNADYEIMYNGIQLGDDAKNAVAISAGYPGYEKDAQNALQVAMKDEYALYFHSIPNAADAKYNAALTDLSAQMLAKLIVAKPEDVDSQYTSLVKTYMAQGGQEVLDEYVKNYKTESGK